MGTSCVSSQSNGDASLNQTLCTVQNLELTSSSPWYHRYNVTRI